MIAKLLTEHHLEFLSLKGGCTGLSQSTLVKMPHCWKSHAMAQYYFMNCMHLNVNGYKQLFKFEDFLTVLLKMNGLFDVNVFPLSAWTTTGGTSD